MPDEEAKNIAAQQTEDLKDLWDDESTIPESNWFSFDNVGDTIDGELVESFDKEGKYGMQRVYVVRKADGNEWNVSLKHSTHKVQIQQLKRAEPGDVVGFRFKESVDTGKGNPAKSIAIRIRHTEKKTAE